VVGQEVQKVAAHGDEPARAVRRHVEVAEELLAAGSQARRRRRSAASSGVVLKASIAASTASAGDVVWTARWVKKPRLASRPRSA
jgi:hypothetical protein